MRINLPITTTHCIFVITLLILLTGVFDNLSLVEFSLTRPEIARGEWWRFISCNFAHFGWAHTLMNLAAFLLCSLAFLKNFSVNRFLLLMLTCCLAVSLGVYYLNPEYETYAGLSGAIHGLIIAGLILNKRHAYWINGAIIALVLAKIINEHRTDYQTTELQEMIPVAVAYDAHLYGALAGLIFGIICWVYDWVISSKYNSNKKISAL